MSENSRPFMNTYMFKNTQLGHWHLGVLGLSFSTHSRILYSAEYFHYKIFTHEKCLENQNYKFQENLSRPDIIDARARYLAATRRLRNTDLVHAFWSYFFYIPFNIILPSTPTSFLRFHHQNTVFISFPHHAFHMPHPSHPPLFHHSILAESMHHEALYAIFSTPLSPCPTRD